MGADDLGPVFRLVYRSHATIVAGRRDDELDAILGVSCLRNLGLGVTGALLAWRDAFVQVLEGGEPAVRALYDRIRTDPRHDRVEMLDADTVPARVFARWSMARVGDHDGVDIPVHLDDASAPAPAAVSTGDPGRDTMLELMRSYARAEAGPA